MRALSAGHCCSSGAGGPLGSMAHPRSPNRISPSLAILIRIDHRLFSIFSMLFCVWRRVCLTSLTLFSVAFERLCLHVRRTPVAH